MRIAICSKEGLFAEALSSLLDQHGQFQVVANENDPQSLVTASKEHRAHILIVDSYQLNPSDLQFLLGARAFGDFGIILIAPREQASDFVDLTVDRLIAKEEGAQGLFSALEQLGGKGGLVAVREPRRRYGAGNDLTPRELEVAQLVGKGMSNRKISQVTGLREQSIKNLVSVIMRKLHCENRVQVALKLTRGTAASAVAE
jgi:DNA-binding NarL/FixJ family response regulator